MTLAILLFLLPFEPRRYTLQIQGLEFTALELAATAAMAALFLANRRRLATALTPLPAPLTAVAVFVAAHLLSAALAPANTELAFRFSARMVAALVLAFLVGASPRACLPPALAASAAGASVVAVLALLEGSGVRSTDRWLALFRAQPFWIGDGRRASGASENPNLAADILMHGLVAATALSGTRSYPPRVSYPIVALLASGLLMTHSRGAMLAGLLSLLVLAASARGPRARAVRAGTLLAVAAGAGTVAVMSTGTGWGRAAEVSGAGYHARYRLDESFLSLRPEETRRVHVHLGNTGRHAWGRGFQASLTHLWYDLEERAGISASQTALPHEVPPGESLSLDVEVQAPRNPGRYLLIWDIGLPGVGTFSTFGVEPAVLPVTVAEDASTPFQAALPQGIWKRGRLEMWRLALAMWRAHPVTGAGPDNYRWLHGAYGGWLTWSVLSRADSAYLEIAATTGTIGLASYLATLVLTAAHALRGLRRSSPEERPIPAAVLAWVTGIAVHGVVDHSLPFTGHYLFFAFVVGVASRLGRPQST